MDNEFDRILRKQGWNLQPEYRFQLPSSNNPLVNAARAIAVTAYPQPKHFTSGGKAERYSISLLAYIARISKITGRITQLPDWAAGHKAASMQKNLDSGLRNLFRAFMIRDLLHSAELMKRQYEKAKNGELSTFTMTFKPDLTGLTFEISFAQTVDGYVLSGKVPDTKLASLRAAILYHRPALERFAGPATKRVMRDQEIDYQNAYNRYVRPSLRVQHIAQVVWQAAQKHTKESRERKIPIDQILMRKPDWAQDIHLKVASHAGAAIYSMKSLGIPSCWCALTHFSEPSNS